MKTINQKMPFTAALLTLLANGTGCKPTSFQSINVKSERTKASQSLSCTDERTDQLRLKNAKTEIIQLSKSCQSDASAAKTPADIVFVIDITGSMDDSLNAVKNGVEQFAMRLRQDKGWDARFAAIGYRDDIAAQVGFTDEKSLSEQIRLWQAKGGADLQEAGQTALAAAVDLLTADLTAAPARVDASKSILFIGDAITYALNRNHFDFTTTQLESVFSAAPKPLKDKLRFYYSAAKEVSICEMATPFGCARFSKSSENAAHSQISSLALKLGLSGRGFEFPFTESILLNEFSEEFMPGQMCQLKTAKIKDSAGKPLGDTGESGTFELPSSFKGKTLTFDVERCCALPSTAKSADKKADSSSASASASCNSSKNTFTLNL
jgi:hypothetical protein